MEGDGEDYFVEISLASVLRKATELENSLRACRRNAAISPQNEGSFSFQRLPGLERSDSAPAASSAVTKLDDHHSNMTDQWQRLTSYIVSLEKEVQYYKQLLQDVKSNCGSDTTAGTESVQRAHGTVQAGDTLERRERTAEYWRKIFHEEPHNLALYFVFSYLSMRELFLMALVCRQWQTVSRHPHLWRRLIFSEIMVDPQVLYNMSKWCSCTEELILHGLMPPIATCNEDLQSYIAKTRGSLEPGLKALMEGSRGSLTSLSITECNLMATERIMWLASVHCPNLQSFTYCSDEFPPSSESLWSLANGCRHLQHLTLPPVLESPHANWFNDNCLSVIAHSWPNLLSLTVGGSSITPDGLQEIAQKCFKLRYLEVIHGPSLHKEAVEKLCTDKGLRSLNRLVLNFTPASHVALQVLLENCFNLKSLELHVTMTSYFSEVDSQTVTNYNKVLTNIKKLKKHFKGKEVLNLYEH